VVRESKDRVRAALASGGFDFPAGRLTVNLAPAELPKEGGRFDLPIALGILLASGQLRPRCSIDDCEFYGELGLTGVLKRVQGLLLAALHAQDAGHRLCAPRANRADLALAGGYERLLVADLAEVVARLRSREPPAPETEGEAEAPTDAANSLDIADVRGQTAAKRALQIAAAGGHHVLLSGPPGAGKSLLAQRLPGLLPALTPQQHREVAAIHSLQGASGATPAPASGRPPFRAPHHTASAHAIVGGGPRASPGEVSLAHHGVLFMDEFPEFNRGVLEALREPLETGAVCISRTGVRAEYPARFQLVAAMNPCPCGRRGDDDAACECTPPLIRRYSSRLSGPLLDRIDLQVTLERVPASVWSAVHEPQETSVQVAATVHAARERQLRRQGCVNAQLTASNTLSHCRLEADALRALERACEHRHLSARGGHRLARIARSIADLQGAEEIGEAAVAEALAYRFE
jgi:magnesium chelatase family protein